MLAYPSSVADRAVSIAAALPITPAQYLTLRREASGLSRMEVA